MGIILRSTMVAAALAFLAIPAVASAHGGNSDPNVVHACISNSSSLVRIVGVSGSCSPSEVPAHWATQGKDGTNGTNGTNGIDGTSVTFVGSFAGNQNGCPNGGLIYAAGNPAVNAYVCNGANATRPDGPCFDTSNRYVDCGNGTVTDTVTGLIWLKNADCLGRKNWAAANAAAAVLADGQCGLTDGSSPGDWRLPTLDEWTATIARARTLACSLPALTNDAGTQCLVVGPSSFVGTVSFFHRFWSSTTYEDQPPLAFAANMAATTFAGLFELPNKTSDEFVWPVRGGSR